MPEKEFIQIYGADQTMYEDVEDIDAEAFEHAEPQAA